jgi:hypothetical protein
VFVAAGPKRPASRRARVGGGKGVLRGVDCFPLSCSGAEDMKERRALSIQGLTARARGEGGRCGEGGRAGQARLQGRSLHSQVRSPGQEEARIAGRQVTLSQKAFRCFDARFVWGCFCIVFASLTPESQAPPRPGFVGWEPFTGGINVAPGGAPLDPALDRSPAEPGDPGLSASPPERPGIPPCSLGARRREYTGSSTPPLDGTTSWKGPGCRTRSSNPSAGRR